MLVRTVPRGLAAADCGILDVSKRPRVERRRRSWWPQRLTGFESRGTATVAGRAVTTPIELASESTE